MKSMRRTKKVAALAAALLLPLLLCAPALGGVLYDDVFSDTSTERPGKTEDTAHGKGWSADTLRDYDRIDFLRFPVKETLSPVRGTIEMELVRGEMEALEGLFALADDSGQPLLYAMLDWDGIHQDRFPEVLVDFHPLISTGLLWYRTYTKKYWNWDKTKVTATKEERLNTVLLGETIPRGGSVHLTFTWGLTADRCTIYLNGEKLEAEVGDPLVMKKAIEKASWLIIGGIPWGPDGGETYLNSTLEYVRTYDSVEDGGQLSRDPRRYESRKGQ